MQRNFSNWIEAFLELTEHSEPPTSFRKWTAISTIAACLQRKTHIMFEGPQYPNMYIILVSPGGRARKGTAMKYGRYFLEKTGVKLAAEDPTRQAVIRRMRLSLKTVNTGEGTIAHSSLTVFSDEFSVFLSSDEKLIPSLCNWFDCPDYWEYETKDTSKTDKVEKVFFNLIGGTTPENIQTYMPPEVIGSGLISRLIFVYEDNKGKIVHLPPDVNTSLFEIEIEDPVSEKMNEMRDKLEEDLFRIMSMKGEFVMTEGFADRWIMFREEHEKNPMFMNSPLRHYNERRPIHLLKLSMIVSAARKSDMIIDEKDFEYALTALKEVEPKMPLAFEGVGRSDIVKVVPIIIKILAGEKQIKLSELLNRTYREVDAEILEKALNQLRKMGRVKWERLEGGDLLIKYIPVE